MMRPRIVDLAQTVRGYISDDAEAAQPRSTSDAPDGDTFDAIAAELGVTRQRVQQLEIAAMAKLRVALELERELGIAAAAPVLAALRGRKLSTFRAALARARRDAGEW